MHHIVHLQNNLLRKILSLTPSYRAINLGGKLRHNYVPYVLWVIERIFVPVGYEVEFRF